MNFKLLTFIFVIGVQSINSSIINKSSIGDSVQISNLVVELMNANKYEGKNWWIDIKSLTFNASVTLDIHGVEYPEVICKDYSNDFCAKGNGKYRAKIIKCKNLDYGKPELEKGFYCELFGARVLNRNVNYGSYIITCASGFRKETARGLCKIQYSFASSSQYNEADDVDNEYEL